VIPDIVSFAQNLQVEVTGFSVQVSVILTPLPDTRNLTPETFSLLKHVSNEQPERPKLYLRGIYAHRN
jgi:hypothetical protein